MPHNLFLSSLCLAQLSKKVGKGEKKSKFSRILLFFDSLFHYLAFTFLASRPRIFARESKIHVTHNFIFQRPKNFSIKKNPPNFFQKMLLMFYKCFLANPNWYMSRKFEEVLTLLSKHSMYIVYEFYPNLHTQYFRFFMILNCLQVYESGIDILTQSVHLSLSLQQECRYANKLPSLLNKHSQLGSKKAYSEKYVHTIRSGYNSSLESFTLFILQIFSYTVG